MFFWLILASLMGVIILGNLHDKIKDKDKFVTPVYDAIATSTYQQHVFAEKGYLDAMRTNPVAAKAYISSSKDGIIPLITVQNGTMSGVHETNAIYSYILGQKLPMYKPQNNTRTYLFCVPKTQILPSKEAGWCDKDGMVKYIATIRQVPQRYDGANKMTILEGIARASSYSRSVGMLQKSSTPLASGVHQPLGAKYFILSSGISMANAVYVPNYIICNFPLTNNGSSFLGAKKTAADGSPNVLGDKSYMIALTLLSGLTGDESLSNPGGSGVTCEALK